MPSTGTNGSGLACATSSRWCARHGAHPRSSCSSSGAAVVGGCMGSRPSRPSSRGSGVRRGPGGWLSNCITRGRSLLGLGAVVRGPWTPQVERRAALAWPDPGCACGRPSTGRSLFRHQPDQHTVSRSFHGGDLGARAQGARRSHRDGPRLDSRCGSQLEHGRGTVILGIVDGQSGCTGSDPGGPFVGVGGGV